MSLSLLRRTSLLLACLAWPIVLQAQPVTASIAGTIASYDGARIPFATLVLTDQGSGRTIRSASDERGTFLFENLVAGTYDLAIDATGFERRAVASLIVPPGATHRLEITLAPASMTEHVTVSAAMPRDSMEKTEVRESPARDVGEALADTAGVWRLRKGAIASDVVLRGSAEPRPERADRRPAHLRRLSQPDGPSGVSRRLLGGRAGGGRQGPLRRPLSGQHGRPRQHRHAAPAGRLARLAGPVDRLVRVREPFGHRRPTPGRACRALGGYSFRRSDPYDDGRGQLFTAVANYKPTEVDSEAFRASTAWGRAAWRLEGGGQLEASYTRQMADHMLYPYLQMDADYDNADRAALRFEQPRSGARVSAIRADVYWSRVDHWMTDELRVSSSTAPRAYSMATDAATNTMGGRAEAQIGTGTTVGGEAFRRNWDTTTLLAGMAYAPQYSIPDVDLDTIGFFAEHARSLGPKTAIDFGGRLDRIQSTADPQKANLALYTAYHATTSTSRTDVIPAGRIKVTHRPTPALQLAVGVGHNARVAEGNERFFALRRMGTDWVGNPDLAPTRNTGIDGSLTVEGQGRSLSLNAFANRVDNYVAVYMAPRVEMVPGVMNTTARSYTNVDALLRGFEVTGSTQLRAHLTFSGDVSYTRGTFDQADIASATSNNLAEMPPLRAQARFRFDNGRAFGELGGIASAAQEKVDSSLGEQTTPSYFILNLHTGMRAGAFAVSVGVANLLDHYYVEHLSYQRDPFRSGVRVAEPGRNLFMNASWQF